MLNSLKNEICPGNKGYNVIKCWHFNNYNPKMALSAVLIKSTVHFVGIIRYLMSCLCKRNYMSHS